MANNYNFENICPDFNHYTLYISGTGTTEFKLAFEEHIEKCPLCAEAFDGLKDAELNEVKQLLRQTENIFRKKTEKHYSNLRLLAYAATILIIAGIFSLAIRSNNLMPNYEQANLFDHSLLIQESITGAKTLSKKSSEQFIYINNCNTIAYNDQIISKDDIGKIKELSNASLLRVEVATNDSECVLEFIENIKESYNVPVVTIKERKHF